MRWAGIDGFGGTEGYPGVVVILFLRKIGMKHSVHGPVALIEGGWEVSV